MAGDRIGEVFSSAIWTNQEIDIESTDPKKEPWVLQLVTILQVDLNPLVFTVEYNVLLNAIYFV